MVLHSPGQHITSHIQSDQQRSQIRHPTEIFAELLRLALFTHPRYMGMGFAITRILKISFSNIGEVTDRIELNFGVCIENMHTNISTIGFVKILCRC